MYNRAPTLFKIRRRDEDVAAVERCEDIFASLPFIARQGKCPRRYSDHVGSLLLLRHLRRSSRGFALDPHVRRRDLWRTHGRPRHRQQPCGVALHVARMRLPCAPVNMLAPQNRRNARIRRGGDTAAPSGLGGKLLAESRH